MIINFEKEILNTRLSKEFIEKPYKKIPENIDLSSLPKIIGDKRKVVISLAGYDEDEVEKYFKLFVDYCVEFGKEFVFEDVSFDKEKI
jgi:hypothetical protein